MEYTLDNEKGCIGLYIYANIYQAVTQERLATCKEFVIIDLITPNKIMAFFHLLAAESFNI